MRPPVPGSRLPRTFLAIATLLGTLFLVVNPPYAVNDEDVHLARIYELSRGRLLTSSDESDYYHDIPTDYATLGTQYQNISPSKDGRVRAAEILRLLGEPRPAEPLTRVRSRAFGYGPQAYLLQIPAVWLARQLNVGALWHVYLARCASLVMYLYLTYRAVLIAGRLRWLFIALALIPMALTQAAGVSSDGLVIGVSLLFYALIARDGLLPGPAPTRATRILLMALLALLTSIKPVYALSGIALTVLRWEGPHARWKRYGFSAASVLVAGALYLFWNRLCNSASVPINPEMHTGGQLKALADAPWRVVKIALLTARHSVDELLIESIFVRHRIAPGMRFLGGLVGILYVQLLLAVAWGAARAHDPDSAPLRRERVAPLLLAWLGAIWAVPGALYLCCVPIGTPEVLSLHGRYFIPAFPALLLALSLLGRPVLARWLRTRRIGLTWALIVGANLLCLLGLIGWHYFDPGDWPL